MRNNFEKMDVMHSSQITESPTFKKISEKSGDSNTNSKNASQKKEEGISTNFLNKVEALKGNLYYNSLEETPIVKSEEKNTCPVPKKESKLLKFLKFKRYANYKQQGSRKINYT